MDAIPSVRRWGPAGGSGLFQDTDVANITGPLDPHRRRLAPSLAKGPARSPRGVRRDTVRHEGGLWGPRQRGPPREGSGTVTILVMPLCLSTHTILSWLGRPVSGRGPSSFPALPRPFRPRRRDDGSVRHLASTGPDDGGGEPLASRRAGTPRWPSPGSPATCRRPRDRPGGKESVRHDHRHPVARPDRHAER